MNRPELNRIYVGDCVSVMRSWPDAFIQTVVTSPPYWGLRDYQVAGQMGLEKSPEVYIAKMIEVFREVRRLLRDDGTLWMNLGDSYNNDRTGGHGATGGLDKSTLESPGHCGASPTRKAVDVLLKPKDLVGTPWRVAFALQADGWYLRSDIIWAKPNPMPESVTDRPTKAHDPRLLPHDSKRTTKASRAVYRYYKGPIFDGLFVCHTCDNKRCVNPDHLYAGTHQDNMRDAVKRKRMFRRSGEDHPQVKLNWLAVRAIRDLYKSGQWSHSRLGAKMGVSKGCIQGILSGVIWKENANV